MWKNAVHAVVGPLALALARATVRRDGELATPSGLPVSHGSGPDPDRVLVLGSNVVAGVGIASYDLSVSGHLARRLAARTGRGADVEVHGVEGFDLRTAADELRRENLARFDLVIILGGVNEILSFMPMAEYERHLRELLDVIGEVPSAPPVMIAGVAPFMQDMDVPNFVADWVSARILRQNAVTRTICDSSRVAEYVPFAPERAGIRIGRDSSAVYESWATALLPFVEQTLASRPRSARPVQDEDARLRALERLGVDPAPDAKVDRIVEMARDMLGVDAASLNFIDRDRQWSKAAAGIDGWDLPRDEAICATTIEQPGAYVIEDVDAEPAYREASWAQNDDHVRFYAGYPVEAPGGQRVGALCVMARKPRRFTLHETATLRDLALRAQEVLWEQRAG